MQEITRKTKTPRITAIEKAVTFIPQKSKEIEIIAGVEAVRNHLLDEVRAGRMIRTIDNKFCWPPNAIVDGVTYDQEVIPIQEIKEEVEVKKQPKKKTVNYHTLSDQELWDLAKKEFPELPKEISRKDMLEIMKLINNEQEI